MNGLINASLGYYNRRDDDVGSTINSNNAIFGSQNILVTIVGVYPALRGDHVRAALKRNSNIVFASLDVFISSRSQADVFFIEDDGFAGVEGNGISIVGSSAARSSGIVNLYSHSHGANHNNSQYQCEYFFHCDFLL